MTRALHADIVVALGGSKHITASLNTFGVSPTTTRLLVAKVAATAEDVALIKAAVAGEQVPVPTGDMGDAARQKKAFKVQPPELRVGSMLDAAVCKGALQES